MANKDELEAAGFIVCKSCNEKYPQEAEYYGHPVDEKGNVIPALDNWPLCEMHAIPFALVAGWKPTRITKTGSESWTAITY